MVLDPEMMVMLVMMMMMMMKTGDRKGAADTL